MSVAAASPLVPVLLAPRHKYAYAAGHCLNDLTASAWFGLVLLVFTQVDQLSKHDAGLLMLIGQVRAATAAGSAACTWACCTSALDAVALLDRGHATSKAAGSDDTAPSACARRWLTPLPRRWWATGATARAHAGARAGRGISPAARA
jgi:hypothetical protein